MAIEIKTKVIDVIDRTPNVKSVRLKNDPAVSFRPGQFANISLDEGKEFSRYLSLSNSPTEAGYIEVTKKITESEFSKRYMNLKIGDAVKIKYPMGNFIYEGQFDKVVFLSGGIGITPIRSMARYAFDKKLDTDMILVYGNHSSADIAFKGDFDYISKNMKNFRVRHVLCLEDKNVECRIGRIDRNIIEAEIKDIFERRFFICGPPAMVTGIKGILSDELKVPAEQVIFENFQGY